MKVVRIRVYDDENYIIEYIYMTNNIDKEIIKTIKYLKEANSHL